MEKWERLGFSGAGAPSPSSFFFYSFFTNKCCFGEGFTTIRTLDLKKSYHHLGPSPMRPNWVPFVTRSLVTRTNFGPAHATELPGHKPLVVNVVVVGPFEEEEEGTGVASDVVKVEGEDPATPGLLP